MRKNKHIAKFNEGTRWYLQNLLVCKRFKPKYEFLIKKREDVGTNHIKDPNAFMECSNRMDDVYQYIDDHKPSRKRKILIVFDGMIADIMSNKNLKPWWKNCLLDVEN